MNNFVFSEENVGDTVYHDHTNQVGVITLLARENPPYSQLVVQWTGHNYQSFYSIDGRSWPDGSVIVKLEAPKTESLPDIEEIAELISDEIDTVEVIFRSAIEEKLWLHSYTDKYDTRQADEAVLQYRARLPKQQQ